MKKCLSFLAVLAMVVVMALQVSALTENQTISLPANQVWVTAGSESRSGNLSTVSARCHSVYPESGVDLYGIIKCQVTNSSGTAITDMVSLNESASDYTSISIKEGFLAASPVSFQFRGNTNAAASAVVSYRGSY